MAETLRLDLPLLLPDVPDMRDACVHRLTASLESREGVERAHIRDAGDGRGAELCIHYDPSVLHLARIRQIAEGIGAQMTDRFGHVVWKIDGIPNQRRARAVSRRVRRLPGVLEAEANATGPLRIEFDRTRTDEDAIRNSLQDMGVSPEGAEPAIPKKVGEAHDHNHAHGGIFGEKTELIFVGLCGGLLLLGWLLPKFVAAPQWLPLTVLIAAYIFGGFYALREAIDSLRNGRFEIDFLMLVAAASSGRSGTRKRSESEFLFRCYSDP